MENEIIRIIDRVASIGMLEESEIISIFSHVPGIESYLKKAFYMGVLEIYNLDGSRFFKATQKGSEAVTEHYNNSAIAEQTTTVETVIEKPKRGRKKTTVIETVEVIDHETTSEIEKELEEKRIKFNARFEIMEEKKIQDLFNNMSLIKDTFDLTDGNVVSNIFRRREHNMFIALANKIQQIFLRPSMFETLNTEEKDLPFAKQLVISGPKYNVIEIVYLDEKLEITKRFNLNSLEENEIKFIKTSFMIK